MADSLHIDHIAAYEPWSYARGYRDVGPPEPISSVSAASEAFLIETSIQLGHLLILASTDFAKDGVLTGIREFSFGSRLQLGEQLDVKVTLKNRNYADVEFECDLSANRRFAARGSFTLEMADLTDADEADRLRFIWASLTS